MADRQRVSAVIALPSLGVLRYLANSMCRRVSRASDAPAWGDRAETLMPLMNRSLEIRHAAPPDTGAAASDGEGGGEGSPSHLESLPVQRAWR